MRSAIVGFIAGIGLLQTQATLWHAGWLIALGVLGAAAMWWNSARADAATTRHASAVFSTQACSLPLQHDTPWRRRQIRLIVQLCLGGLLGFCWAGAMAVHALKDRLAPELEGVDLLVTGVVDSLPTYAADGIRFDFRIESGRQDGHVVEVPAHVSLGWYAERGSGSPGVGVGVRGDAEAPAPAMPEVQPGERWQLAVRLQKPHGNANPDGFDYEAWLLEQGLRATGQVRARQARAAIDTPAIPSPNRQLDAFVARPGTIVERLRSIVRKKILVALPDKPYAGAMVALVIGDQRAIPQSDWTIFNRTGIGHLVSISGLHITMIAGLFAGMMHFLWRHSFCTGLQLPLLLPAQKAAALTAASTALLYVLLAGFGVPAQRTLYMIWVVAAALWCGRINSVSHVLCLAAGVVTLLDPWAVSWPGFWLSFGAVAIILYASTGRTRSPLPAVGTARHIRLLASLREAAHTQYVVTLGLVPLTILLFGQVSLVAPLANAIAIPLVSLVVTPLALAGAFMPAPLSTLLLNVAHALFAWLAMLLTRMSEWDGAVWATPAPAFWMFGCAMVGALWLLAPRGWPSRWLGMAGWLPLLCNTAAFPTPGEMTVTAFDVGQGMALLIETGTHRLLYDTGPFYSPGSDGASRVILPYLKARGIDRLDGVVISHNDNDHSGGALSLFAALPIGWVASSLAADSPIVAAAPAHQRCIAGQRWRWDGIDFEMLHPGAASYDSDKWKPNARSCTLKITRGAESMLLPGDIEAIQEEELIGSIPEKLRATILLAPHHGSGTSSTLPFLQMVQPRIAIFQVGYRNRYRHPKPDVYARYADLGIVRLRSDDAGAITLHFGDSLSVADYRTRHARYWYGR